MVKSKTTLIYAILFISVIINIYNLFRPKPMITAASLGWEGYFEEYDCLGKKSAQCPAMMGASLCRKYYCFGLLTNKHCYVQHLEKNTEGEDRVIKEQSVCK